MRLDNYLVEINQFDSRTKAKQAIERGEIYVNGALITKCAFEIDENKAPEIKRLYAESFVSLGGYKLSKALFDFNFSVKDLIVADIGASTGGFTDCLLQSGAKTVYAVDLNDGLLHEKLKNDKRVVSIIKNARSLTTEDFAFQLNLIVADLSFISATYVLEVFSRLLKSGGNLLLLIKPQFETGERKKFKNGIIRDEKIRNIACEKVITCAKEYGFILKAMTTAPIVEGKNLEYLALFEKTF